MCSFPCLNSVSAQKEQTGVCFIILAVLNNSYVLNFMSSH